MSSEQRRGFIAAHTRALSVPSLPQITLYQADEVTPLWLMTEADMVRDRLAPPFWAFAWSGGQALARYLFDHPETVEGRRVLDLACGSGLVGIAAALNGAQSVICNDIDPYAETAVAMNAALNSVEPAFLAGNLLSGDPPPVDVVLAGDIAYEAPMTDAMLTFLRRCLAQGCDVWVGDPHRTYFPASGFERLARYDIVTNPDIEDAAVKPASVWRMSP
ncbi:methyltransferase small domain protein [Asticcacaulis biprosthecium C19]|uniref:Methyltransferase small domain protein n=1 Tax=Asticcacaulis biprosthecium C19 TaxID=715226 RepID=F4QS90_9CAUL|nr:50S ribosomal protein L11 methyltransferase [Asticcacaulis biprosthecium]EGF89610.1 methyltransferase small domain protein [Asticcacaulis biprosthecium C19]